MVTLIVRTLRLGILYKDVCISHAEQGLENAIWYRCIPRSGWAPCCI